MRLMSRIKKRLDGYEGGDEAHFSTMRILVQTGFLEGEKKQRVARKSV